jgi:AcrR family transcriptional regulator
VRVQVAPGSRDRNDSTVTGTGGRRETKRRQTHDRIFDEAMRLFRERGFDAVAVGDIAAAAGVSVPTFYAHYESKDHLILAMPDPADVEQLLHSFPRDMPPADVVRGAIVTALVDGAVIGEREQILDRWRIIAASPRLRLTAAGFERATAEIMIKTLAPDESVSPTTRVTVTALLSAYTQILLRWAESAGERPIEEVIEEVLGALRDLSP